MKLSILQSTLGKLGIEPRKSLGQNFLHDQNLAKWIVRELTPAPGGHFVEIGPGLGALTEWALATGASGTLIEKDGRLVEFLRERFAGENVEILHADAATVDVRQFFPHGPVKVLGNLPYYVSSAILFNFTQEPSPAGALVFTLQRELASRLSARPSTKDYGALTLLIQRRWRVEYLRTLPASVFVPAPKVDSAVVKLTPRPEGDFPDCDAGSFRTLVREGFSQRRKQLRKMLQAHAADWGAVAAHLGVVETVRAEELTLEQWIALTNFLRPLDVIHAQDVHGEQFPVVDENDLVTGSAPRQLVHDKDLRHRAVHLYIFNRAGELLLQKRSRWKDRHPGVWDSSASGHVNAGEEYDAAAEREIVEELGVSTPLEQIGQLSASERTGWEFIRIYRGGHEGPFHPPPAEIECVGFFPLDLVARWVTERPQDFAPGFIECFRLVAPDMTSSS